MPWIATLPRPPEPLLMAETATRIAIGERLWRIALALLPALALVLLRGVDTNWDLRNYHLYDPHAWWTGRMAIDIAPAQLQTWHNPLLDLPLYLIVQSGWDLRWASAWPRVLPRRTPRAPPTPTASTPAGVLPATTNVAPPSSRSRGRATSSRRSKQRRTPCARSSRAAASASPPHRARHLS